MSDYMAFYDSANLLLKGIYGSLYPLPLVYLTLPITLVPPTVGYVILTIVSLMILVYLMKREALMWIFYVPFLQMLVLGQIDAIFLLLYKLDNPYSLALMTLKPQLFILAIPNIWKRLKEKNVSFFVKFGTTISLIYIPFFFIRPMWIFEWIGQMDDGRLSHSTVASFYAVPGGLLARLCVMAIALMCFIVFKNWKGMSLSLNPAVRPYDAVMLIGESKLLIIISWILFPIVNYIQADWVWAFLGLFSNWKLTKKEIPDTLVTVEQPLGG